MSTHQTMPPKSIQHFFSIAVLLLCMYSCAPKGPYNPYLHRKKKVTVEQTENDLRLKKKQAKAYERHLGNNRKHLFGRRKAK